MPVHVAVLIEKKWGLAKILQTSSSFRSIANITNTPVLLVDIVVPVKALVQTQLCQ